MQASYAAAFERDVGGTEAEWLMRLPEAVGGRPIVLSAGAAQVQIDGGALALAWRVLPPRRIALMSMPRMAVNFRFDRLGDDARYAFMRHFDLVMQRGGG